MQATSLLGALLVLSFAVPAFAENTVKNGGDKPIGLFLVDQDKKWNAALYLAPGEAMQLGEKHTPVSGAGYYEALSGSTYIVRAAVPLKFENKFSVCALHVNKVGWDHTGNLTILAGLRPFLFGEGTSDIPIVSDAETPMIANGNVYIKLGGHGVTDYWVKIKFGQIVGIGKAGEPEK